jgi:hypothetical protein
MKKLIYVLSAIGTAFAGTASADVSVSGSSAANYASSGANQYTAVSGGVSFALSTTTASGMTISTSGGITTDLEATATRASTGLTSLAFATGGTTITIGNDVAAPQIGNVGSVASDMADQGHQSIDASPAIGTDADQDGAGVTMSTAVGGGTFTAAYIWDGALRDADGQGNPDSANSSMGFSYSMPAGPATVTFGYSSSADNTGTNDTMTGATIAYPVSGGTLSVGYQTTTGDTDAKALSAKYSMSLDADTTIAVGIKSSDEGAASASTTEAKITRSIGGGASIFAELKNSSGNSTGVGSATSGASSTFVVGTTVAF